MSSEVNFKELLNNSTDIILITTDKADEDRRVKYVNNIFYDILEVTNKDKVHRDITTYVHPDDVRKVDSLKQACTNNPGVTFDETVRFISKNGNIVSVDWNVYYNEDQGHYIGIGRNIQSKLNQEGFYGDAKKLAKIGMWEYHVEKNHLKWDDEIFNIYELSNSTDITLQRMKQFFRKESLEIFETKLKNLIDHGVAFDEELSFISGKFRPSTARFMAKCDNSGNQKGTVIFGTVQDLTDVRRIERKAEDYHEAVDKSSIVSITDRYGIITEVNDKFCEITKYSREELIGQSHKVLNSSFHPENFWKDMWDTIIQGEVWRGEIKNKAKDDSIYWVDTTIIPFKNSIGRIYQYLAIQRDYTENKKLNEELMVSEKLSSIGEISAQILHEVMTPLHIISLSIENLEDDICELKEEQEKLNPIRANLNEIKANYDKIEEIFENMRSILVRKQGGEPSEVDIKDTLTKTLTLVKAKLKSKDITVRIDKVPDNILIRCTQSDLSQVFLNLINNSADAIEKQKERWIDIKVELKNRTALILFQDSGKGIPKEIASRMFETLFTTKGEERGTGLGMGVCKKLVERHRGTIEIDEKATNTTFVIAFPLSN